MSVVMVTGASSGIGAAIAIAFAEAGWNVMAAGRDEGRLAEVADVSDNISTWAGELETSADCDELVADALDAPLDKLAGKEQEIWKERDRKLEAARELRRQRRQAA